MSGASENTNKAHKTEENYLGYRLELTRKDGVAHTPK